MVHDSVDIGNAAIVKREGYTQILEQIQAEGLCPFCEENLAKHHASEILFQNTHWTVTPNDWPYEGSKHHLLLIAREHISNIASMSPDAWKDLGESFTWITDTYKLPGATLFMRSGDTALTGASVQHLHAHVVSGSPRTEGGTPITALIAFK